MQNIDILLILVYNYLAGDFMIIDLTSLVTNLKEKIIINQRVDTSSLDLSNTNIRKLNNTYFKGEITRIGDNTFSINGVLSGSMILPDDITLEDVEHIYEIQIDENFGESTENDENNIEIVQNTIDILPFLWQNIIVEIPLKVVGDKNRNKTTKGNGWRLINEDEVNTDNNSPFSDLQKLLDSKGRSE